MNIVISIIGYLLFLATGITCINVSRKILRSYLNVTTALIIPYIFVCSLQVFVTMWLGFFAVPNFFYWFLLSVFFFFTLLFEVTCNKILIKDNNSLSLNDCCLSKSPLIVKRSFHIFISVLLIYVLYDTYKQINNANIALLLQDDFQNNFSESVSGSFYTRIFLMICGTYYIVFGDKYKGLAVGVLCFVPNIVVNTKGILLIPILASFTASYISGKINNVRKTLSIVFILGIIIFWGSYLYEYSLLDNTALLDVDTYRFIGSKFVAYILSGVQSFSQTVILNAYYLYDNLNNITIANINSLLAKIGLSAQYPCVNPIIISLGTLPEYGVVSSNVNTYIGTLYLFNGLIGGLILHAFWIFVTICIKNYTLKTKNPFFIVLYSLFLSAYFLGWFEFYLMHTFWIYFIIMTVAIKSFFTKTNIH